MSSLRLSRLVTAVLWLAAQVIVASGPVPNTRKQAPPKLMLWSWFADDDFSALKDGDIGIAYLALSLWFEGQSQVTPVPRYVPVRIPSGAYRMVVVRFDYDTGNGASLPAFTPAQRQLAVRMVAEIAALEHPQGVQIDFDAPRSAWPFYRQLLADVRDRLGPDVFLSVTALVSWCDSPQSWLAGLPVDEVVPMAFYMGQASPAVITRLQRGGQFVFPGCRASIGVNLGYGEPVRPRKDQRGYLFAQPQSWSPAAVRAAREAFLP